MALRVIFDACQVLTAKCSQSLNCGVLTTREWVTFEQEHIANNHFIVCDWLGTASKHSFLSRFESTFNDLHTSVDWRFSGSKFDIQLAIHHTSINLRDGVFGLCLLFTENNHCCPLSFTDVCLHARSAFFITASGLKWFVDRVYEHTTQISST